MNIDHQFVQDIVGRVLERLGTSAGTLRDTTVDSSTAVPADSPTELVIADKVVTEDLLAARVNGHRQVVVTEGSVVTPSGHDFLRTAGLTLSRSSTSAARPSTAAWKAVVLSSTEALDKLLEDVAGWTVESHSCERGAVRQIAASGDVGTCVFTASPERVACRCNRNSQLRAAVATDVISVRRVQAEVGANVFCVNAEGRSYFELRNMLRTMSAVTPAEPKEWD